MLNEHAIVFAKERISETVDAGCIGVIVYIYDNDTYEVEFFDNNNSTIDIFTVLEHQIQEKL